MNILTTAVFKNIITINKRQREIADRTTFNVSWGVDRNYQTGAAISLASILENNKSIKDFTFHIISDNFDEVYLQRLEQLATRYKTVIKLYQIDPVPLKKLPKSDVWPISIYYRLISFEYFSDKLNTLLYLDADVICIGGIHELINLEMTNEYGAVVLDVDSMQEKSAMRLGSSAFEGHYFNSGVMYINMLQWHANRLTNKAFQLLSDDNIVSRLKYPDQDILNIILLGHAFILSRKFNTIYTLKSEFEKKDQVYYKHFINNETIFIHYTGVTKPWHTWADYPVSQFFRRVYESSPWKEQSYCRAKRTHEMKEEYKHLLHQGFYFKGLISSINYNIKKIIK